MTRYTSEQVQEIVEDWEGKYNKLEEEYSYLKEELEDLKAENEDLEDKCKSYQKANQTVLDFYREDCGKMDDLQSSSLCCYTSANDLLIYQIGVI